MPTLRYTLDDTAITASELGRWVWERMGRKLPSRECLAIARSLLDGGVWEPQSHSISDRESAGPCSYTIIPDPDPELEAFLERKRQWADNAVLLNKAVAGDAEAAITYCRKIASGEINFAVYAGAA